MFRQTAPLCYWTPSSEYLVCRGHVGCASHSVGRRQAIMVVTTGCVACVPSPSSAGDFVTMEAIKDKDYGKTPMKFSDFELSQSGVQYKDLRDGSGAVPQTGDTCVIDWQGYTVGYYGRVFEARNKVCI